MCYLMRWRNWLFRRKCYIEIFIIFVRWIFIFMFCFVWIRSICCVLLSGWWSGIWRRLCMWSRVVNRCCGRFLRVWILWFMIWVWICWMCMWIGIFFIVLISLMLNIILLGSLFFERFLLRWIIGYLGSILFILLRRWC